MGPSTWIALIVLIVMIIGFAVGTTRYAEGKRNEAKIEAAKGRERIYERFDDYKKTTESKMETGYVQKEICQLLHGQLENDLKEIKGKVDMIPSMKAQLDVIAQNFGVTK